MNLKETKIKKFKLDKRNLKQMIAEKESQIVAKATNQQEKEGSFVSSEKKSFEGKLPSNEMTTISENMIGKQRKQSGIMENIAESISQSLKSRIKLMLQISEPIKLSISMKRVSKSQPNILALKFNHKMGQLNISFILKNNTKNVQVSNTYQKKLILNKCNLIYSHKL